jgi:hypothetical protein
VEAMPKHKQAGHTTVLTKYAQTPKKRLQCRSHPNTTLNSISECRTSCLHYEHSFRTQHFQPT